MPHTVPCGEGTAAFEGVMRELGLEVPTGNDDHDYDDPDSYSDGDDADADDDDDDDDDSSARASKTARLASSDGDGEMDAAPAAGDAVAVVVAWLLIPVRFACSDALCNHDALCKPPSAGAGAGSS